MNATNWGGAKLTWKKDSTWIKEACGVDIERKEGAATWDVDTFLRINLFLKVKKILHKPKLSEIDKQLNKGRCLIIGYLHPGGRAAFGHYIVCVGKTKKYYKVVNEKKYGPALRKMSRKTMYKKLKRTRVEPGVHYFSVIWCLEKK